MTRLHEFTDKSLALPDERIVSRSVNNKVRFLDAASHLYAKLKGFVSSGSPDIEADRQSLIQDLDTAIGDDAEEDEASEERLVGYGQLAGQDAYGHTAIPEYQPKAWFKAAIKTTRRQIGSPSHGGRTDTLYTFKPGHETSDWYKFQQAVMAYAERSQAILCETPAIAAQYTA